ncbi:hypothetical chaperone protein [Gemmobacter megaterium]|uniref:Hypothetical chaperone protein n=1 Tax=Gemmobacter megaterium TaxID=1086013 RepID=A0A1N7LPZ5_9RHOB|nr:Hsp70 family protein [Gemmobacter megaterium]GGE11197.1 molecular chaperone DnaK [Gemmobacter megaterium]SIS75917.1 hypothetical chaperone protein [Gemmobacter megaterium]
MPAPTLAVDFGTSNTAVAILENGTIRRLEIERGADTLPTAVFFPLRGEMRIGSDAARALIEGAEGRYMRALKSVLGTALFHEPRLIAGRRRTLADIVTAFLVALKARAEAQTGHRFTRVLSGRPVHFHTNAPDRDQQAEADLRGCYHAAGFDTVEFLFEPEAAAISSRNTQGLGLIVDIGGGTSDFTVFRSGARMEILASHGIRLGGTDFDHAVSMHHAMPLLGLGGQLRRTFGEGLLPVPRGIYVDLSTWAMIPFLYSRDTERLVEDMMKHAVDVPAMARLASVITDQLGHDLAFAVEAGKIAANEGHRDATIDMSMIAPGLTAPISPAGLTTALTESRLPLGTAIRQTLFAAGTDPEAVQTIVLVGGSSLLSLVQHEARAACPAAHLHRSEVFTAVVDGLALATA